MPFNTNPGVGDNVHRALQRHMSSSQALHPAWEDKEYTIDPYKNHFGLRPLVSFCKEPCPECGSEGECNRHYCNKSRNSYVLNDPIYFMTKRFRWAWAL